MRTTARIFLAVVVALAAARASYAALTRIGAAAAVAGGVTATSEGEAVGHVLSSGKPIYLNDHVVSDAKGRLQVLLLDETVFTLGPNADMVLDEFVYDPATSSGKVTARVVTGAFRFVTGKMASKDPGQMKVKAGVATIGIRGTVVACTVTGQSTTCVLLGPGQNTTGSDRVGSIRVEGEGRTVEINRAGYATVVEQGKPPSPPFRVSPEFLKTAFGALAAAPPEQRKDDEAKGGQPGGGESKPGEGKVVVDEAKMEVVNAILALTDTNTDLNKAQNNSNVTNSASQEDTRDTGATLNGISSWDSLRALTGTAYYTGEGTYDYATRPIAAVRPGYLSSGSGSWSFNIDVDFNNRTVGGGSSYLSIINGPLAYPNNPNSSTSWATAASFASLTGNAVITQKSVPGAGEIQGSNDYFNLTTIQFNTVDGTAAKEMQVDLHYEDLNGTASGTAKGAAHAPCTSGCLNATH